MKTIKRLLQIKEEQLKNEQIREEQLSYIAHLLNKIIEINKLK
jgi:hypothetical protein